MGRLYPSSLAAMRGVKAEGGWSVIFNEACDIHYSADNPRNIRLWDAQDLPVHRHVVDSIHEHGSLAGVMLAHYGYFASNYIGREIPMAPSASAGFGFAPTHARTMDKEDIRAFRKWHRSSAILAAEAGYDLIMIYCSHDLSLLMHFISRRHNQRIDEYGGSLENRARLFREVIEDTKDAVGDRCAVGARLAVDELLGPEGISFDAEGADLVEMLGDLPDYWDVNLSRWYNDSATSRFAEEGRQEPYVSFVKKVSSKPVVGVGRFTSPDAMVRQIRKGILDMIGAARPSIADPFLPRKIEEGRLEDIRECIGCNMCVTNHYLMAPIRCTQNPTMGEEWRRNWHPERMPEKASDESILIVGAGPAGLEAARGLGQRGYQVLLAEASTELGGRVSLESRLPGLVYWSRVRDYRVSQLEKMPNVEVYLESRLKAQDVLDTGCDVVAIATGSRWRNDGVGRQTTFPIERADDASVLTPDDIMTGRDVAGSVVVYEDDHYYMANVVAEKLALDGCQVTIVTPAFMIARFTEHTLEIIPIHKRMAELDVRIVTNHALQSVARDHVVTKDVFSGAEQPLECSHVVMVAGRSPQLELYDELVGIADQETPRVSLVGDSRAPGTIAAAVFAGHQFARELDVRVSDHTPFLREDVAVSGETVDALIAERIRERTRFQH